MEKVIKKAIEGGLKEGENWVFVRANNYWASWLNGNGDDETIAVERYCMSSDFWKCLSKSCGWTYTTSRTASPVDNEKHSLISVNAWRYYAMQFHEKNFIEGWEKAVSWLETLIDNELLIS